MAKFAKGYGCGWVACIEHKTGTFPNGSKWLYSSPFATEQQALDWAEAFKDSATLVRVEPNPVPLERIVRES